MLWSAESSAAGVKKEFFSPSVPLHNSRGARARGCLRGGCGVAGGGRISDVLWLSADRYGKYIFSYVSEVGTVSLALERQPCPSVPKQPTKSIRRGAAAWEWCVRAYSCLSVLRMD